MKYHISTPKVNLKHAHVTSLPASNFFFFFNFASFFSFTFSHFAVLMHEIGGNFANFTLLRETHVPAYFTVEQ